MIFNDAHKMVIILFLGFIALILLSKLGPQSAMSSAEKASGQQYCRDLAHDGQLDYLTKDKCLRLFGILPDATPIPEKSTE